MATAVKRLSALAQYSRLSVLSFLVEAGPDGVCAGEIARTLGVTPNTLSAQLNVLANAGLVRSRRQGRSIIYAADCDQIGDLLVFLTDECCHRRPEICEALADVVSPPRGAEASA